jgi:hypothetical protein
VPALIEAALAILTASLKVADWMKAWDLACQPVFPPFLLKFIVYTITFRPPGAVTAETVYAIRPHF